MVRNKLLCVGEGVASRWTLEKCHFEAPGSGSRRMSRVWVRPAPVHQPLGAGRLLVLSAQPLTLYKGLEALKAWEAFGPFTKKNLFLSISKQVILQWYENEILFRVSKLLMGLK